VKAIRILKRIQPPGFASKDITAVKKTALCGLILVVVFTLVSCAGASRQQRGTAIGTGVGAGLGAIVGQAIGHNTEGTLIGAGIGALVGGITGNQIGGYMDRQEQDLRDAMAASEAASIQRTEEVLTATFKSEILFDFDSAILRPAAYTEITRVAGILRKYPYTTITVEGHTDSRGSEVYNQELSERRAQAVKGALVQQGVDSMRIQAIGYGESQPISSDDDLNRRVNIVIAPTAQG